MKLSGIEMSYTWPVASSWQFHVYLLRVMYMTFQYLTDSCILATGHVYDISILDSFMYTCYRSCIWHLNSWQFHVYLLQVMYMTFQFLTVSCILATGHVYDILIPDSFMYTCHRSCIWHFNSMRCYACYRIYAYRFHIYFGISWS